jgi:hypothetical protein
MHMAFQNLYIYDYIIKLCGQQAQVIQNHENAHIWNIGQDEAQRRNIKLGWRQAYMTIQVTKQPL